MEKLTIYKKYIDELVNINRRLIDQNFNYVIKDKKWENESENAKINYAAGFNAALEFTNNQVKNLIENKPLHHLENLNKTY